jgi:hypothetical protein
LINHNARHAQYKSQPRPAQAPKKYTTMLHYKNDPYWMTAKFAGPSNNKDGTPIKKGDRIFYYPSGRQVFVGAEADAAAADFQACAEDEAFMTGQY